MTNIINTTVVKKLTIHKALPTAELLLLHWLSLLSVSHLQFPMIIPLKIRSGFF